MNNYQIRHTMTNCRSGRCIMNYAVVADGPLAALLQVFEQQLGIDVDRAITSGDAMLSWKNGKLEVTGVRPVEAPVSETEATPEDELREEADFLDTQDLWDLEDTHGEEK